MSFSTRGVRHTSAFLHISPHYFKDIRAMALLRFVAHFLFVRSNSGALVAVPQDSGASGAELLLGKDELGNWWPVTIVAEHPDDTVACVVDDDVRTLWPSVHRANLRGSNESVSNQSHLIENELRDDIEHGIELVGPRATQWWRYTPCNGKTISVREDAAVGAKKTSKQLQPGDVFQVDGTHLDDDGILHLRLADGSGWLFDQMPGGCSLCTPISFWRYTPYNRKAVSVREDAAVEAKKTSKQLQPGDVFQVDGTYLDGDGILHLRLADGSGWLFNQIPHGTMCSPIDDGVW